MKGEKFINEYPFEDLLPELDEKQILGIVKNCEYTIEADRVTIADKYGKIMKVNITDAKVFYRMGYEAAKQRIESILKPTQP